MIGFVWPDAHFLTIRFLYCAFDVIKLNGKWPKSPFWYWNSDNDYLNIIDNFQF